jgi:hypothetical protein
MEQIIEKAHTKLGIDVSTARLYYKSLVYQLSDREKEGLELFYKGLHQKGVTDHAAPLFFFGNGIKKTVNAAPLSCADSTALSIGMETAGCCPMLRCE